MNKQPGLGIFNEFTLGASGELDNGYAWSYAIDYTMGGMTLAIAMNDHENVQYSNAKDVKDTVFSVAMAF